MAQYAKPEYWDERYTKDPEPFDWYQRWAGLKDVFSDYLNENHQVLMVGCGNSRLSEDLYEEGFHSIHNIDVSNIVIKAMQEKYANDKTGMTFQQMDLRALDFPEGIFNVVIDKATVDCILCGEGSSQNAQKALSEVSRVLSPAGGVFLCVSHGQPSYRLNYLQRPEYGWTVRVHTVQKPMMGMTSSLPGDDKDNVHYIYVCVRGEAQGAVDTPAES